jgi:hypothetical protein
VPTAGWAAGRWRVSMCAPPSAVVRGDGVLTPCWLGWPPGGGRDAVTTLRTPVRIPACAGPAVARQPAAAHPARPRRPGRPHPSPGQQRIQPAHCGRARRWGGGGRGQRGRRGRPGGGAAPQPAPVEPGLPGRPHERGAERAQGAGPPADAAAVLQVRPPLEARGGKGGCDVCHSCVLPACVRLACMPRQPPPCGPPPHTHPHPVCHQHLPKPALIHTHARTP